MPKREAHKTAPAPRVLSLNLHRQWFDEIAVGKKKFEYREAKPFWKKRLEGRTYDEIHFRNGYATDAPFMRVEFRGVRKQSGPDGKHYAIRLGRVFGFKNYRCPKP